MSHFASKRNFRNKLLTLQLDFRELFIPLLWLHNANRIIFGKIRCIVPLEHPAIYLNLFFLILLNSSFIYDYYDRMPWIDDIGVRHCWGPRWVPSHFPCCTILTFKTVYARWPCFSASNRIEGWRHAGACSATLLSLIVWNAPWQRLIDVGVVVFKKLTQIPVISGASSLRQQCRCWIKH